MPGEFWPTLAAIVVAWIAGPITARVRERAAAKAAAEARATATPPEPTPAIQQGQAVKPDRFEDYLIAQVAAAEAVEADLRKKLEAAEQRAQRYLVQRNALRDQMKAAGLEPVSVWEGRPSGAPLPEPPA